MAQLTFCRKELKYLLTEEQYQILLSEIGVHIRPDKYANYTICNIYYDTEHFDLIRRSIEKPAYKEKIRLRSYRRADAGKDIFVELKKKCKGVVFKRRLTLREDLALTWAAGVRPEGQTSQIADEIDYFIRFYGTVKPAVYLCYDREAYFSKDGSDFRITFDDTILCRRTDMTLDSDPYGTPILPEDMVLMEVKCAGGIPLWLTKVLTEEHIYKTSFSKYGTAYETLIYPNLKEETIHGSIV
jgi:hypothetical protein